MSKKWLIDTDVLIDYLKGVSQAIEFLDKIIERTTCYLSVITVAELYAGIREGKEKQLFENFLRVFEVIPIDENLARIGGLYRREYGKTHGVGLADAMIAATVEELDLRLVTLNKKHFPMLKDIMVPYSKSN
ncbi:MAG: type II toxin-antitoxin system VapC family toxin [Gammaproteobacteria bacterium]|nr:MAG: type II toxin-antitoxin system VapC family toxin [Gammaproteobacteria bacterium]